MATVFYDQAEVNVSFGDINETLLASNCSINFASPSQPMYAIGRKGALGQFPAGARAGGHVVWFHFKYKWSPSWPQG